MVFIYIYIYFFFELFTHIFNAPIAAPFESTLLIMYTHESITGHCAVCLIATSPRLFNVFSTIIFRDETAPPTTSRILLLLLFLFILYIIMVQCKLNFSPELIPTSIHG